MEVRGWSFVRRKDGQRVLGERWEGMPIVYFDSKERSGGGVGCEAEVED